MAEAGIEEALERARSGDPAALGELFRAFEPDLARASHEAFEQVVRAVRAAQDAGWRAGIDTRLLAGCVWASVHGLATLWSSGAFTVTHTRSLDEAIETTLELVAGDQRGESR